MVRRKKGLQEDMLEAILLPQAEYSSVLEVTFNERDIVETLENVSPNAMVGRRG